MAGEGGFLGQQRNVWVGCSARTWPRPTVAAATSVPGVRGSAADCKGGVSGCGRCTVVVDVLCGAGWWMELDGCRGLGREWAQLSPLGSENNNPRPRGTEKDVCPAANKSRPASLLCHPAGALHRAPWMHNKQGCMQRKGRGERGVGGLTRQVRRSTILLAGDWRQATCGCQYC